MKKIFFLFAFLSLFITTQWFKTGRLMAAGEEGLTFFRPERTVELYKSIWFETGTGALLPVYLPRLTFFGLAVPFDMVIETWEVQAVFFTLVLFFGILGTYLFTKIIFSDNLVAFSSSLLYLFNLYSQNQVWNRFLYAGMFAWAYLPIFLFLSVKWINTRELRWLFLFVVSSLFFSNAFGQPAFLFTLWIPVGLYLVFHAWTERKKHNLFKIFLNFMPLFSSWVLANIWWIYPYFRIGASNLSEVADWKANLNSLIAVSHYFTNEQVFLLRQSFLLGKDSLLYSFYSQTWVYAASLLILLIVCIGLVATRRTKYWKFLFPLLLVGWFVSKGANPPFGTIFFKFIFTNFPFTQALRNPYEKFGVVWLLPYTIFFSAGLREIYGRVNRRYRGFVVLIVLVVSCGILVWPMWTGFVFPPYTRVSVPSYYSGANKFLDSDNADGRTLMLPIIPGDGVKYTWGYIGVEPSEFLFDRPAISKILRTRYFDDKYWELEKAFVGGKNYNQFLDETNIKYLVLHDDLISEASGASSSAEVKQTLNGDPEIHFLTSFGQLEIYEYTGNTQPGLFIADGTNPRSLDYQKLSTTNYKVNIKNATGPFKLIFKETYDDFWEARINGQKIQKHFLVYDYANGWEIDKIGDYNIEIVFRVWPWD